MQKGSAQFVRFLAATGSADQSLVQELVELQCDLLLILVLTLLPLVICEHFLDDLGVVCGTDSISMGGNVVQALDLERLLKHAFSSWSCPCVSTSAVANMYRGANYLMNRGKEGVDLLFGWLRAGVGRGASGLHDGRSEA